MNNNSNRQITIKRKKFKKWLSENHVEYIRMVSLLNVNHLYVLRSFWRNGNFTYAIDGIIFRKEKIYGIKLELQNYKPGDIGWEEKTERYLHEILNSTVDSVYITVITDETITISQDELETLDCIGSIRNGTYKYKYLEALEKHNGPVVKKIVGFVDDSFTTWWAQKEPASDINNKFIEFRKYPYGFEFYPETDRSIEALIEDIIAQKAHLFNENSELLKYTQIPTDYTVNAKVIESINHDTLEILPHPQISTIPLYDVFYDKVFIAGVFDGNLWTSIDGIEWNSERIDTQISLVKIVKGDNFYLGFKYNEIYKSEDLLSWQLSHRASKQIKDIVFSNGLFICIGGSSIYTNSEPDGYIIKSTDGINWDVISESPRLTGTSYGLSWDGNRLYIGDERGRVRYTDNLVHFKSVRYDSKSPLAFSNVHQITNVKDKIFFLAYKSSLTESYILCSDDGITFKEVKKTKKYLAKTFCYANDNLILCCSNGGIYYSKDGIKWKLSKTGGINDIETVLYSEGQYLCYDNCNSLWLSPDLKNWTQAIKRSIFNIYELLVMDDVRVAIGYIGSRRAMKNSGVIGIGLNKEALHSVYDIDEELNDIAYGKGKLIIAGNNGSVITSTDLKSFACTCFQNSRVMAALFACDNYHIAVYKDKVNHVYNSIDASTWEGKVIDGLKGPIMKMDFIHDHFVAVSRNGSMISKDALNWEQLSDKGYNGISCDEEHLILFGDTKIEFWEIGKKNYIMVKRINFWDELKSSLVRNISDVLYVEGKYVLVDSIGAVHISRDLETWERLMVLDGSYGSYRFVQNHEQYAMFSPNGNYYCLNVNVDY